MLVVNALPLIPPISTFSSFRNCCAVSKNCFTVPSLSRKLSYLLKTSCSYNRTSNLNIKSNIPETVKHTWNSQLFGILSPVKYDGNLDLYSWKQARNSFKFLIETFTLSRASSTLEDKRLMNDDINNFQSMRFPYLNLENWHWVKKSPGHVNKQIANFLQME